METKPLKMSWEVHTDTLMFSPPKPLLLVVRKENEHLGKRTFVRNFGQLVSVRVKTELKTGPFNLEPSLCIDDWRK